MLVLVEICVAHSYKQTSQSKNQETANLVFIHLYKRDTQYPIH